MCESGTSDGGAGRVNEFRRIAAGESRQTIMGTLGAYEEQTNSGVWTQLKPYDGPAESGEGQWELPKLDHADATDVQWVRQKSDIEITEENLGDRPREMLGKVFKGLTPAHPLDRLPDEFAGQPNGHEGAHQFLVVDFMEALKTNKLPPNHVWAGARYNAPGIVAHQSAIKGGELLKIPDYGLPPEDAVLMDPGAGLLS